MKHAVLILLLIFTMIFRGCTSMPRYSFNVPRPVAEQDTILESTGFEPSRFTPSSRIDDSKMDEVIARYISVPYHPGGTGNLGLDCSGLVYVVYRDYDGTRLPITVRTLYRLDDRVPKENLAYGDLVFFNSDDQKVSHVGIYLGDGKFVHSSETRGVVIDDLADDYFASLYAGARRVK